jgi:hypothetical protein
MAIQWDGRVECMGDEKCTQNFSRKTPKEQALGIPKSTWEHVVDVVSAPPTTLQEVCLLYLPACSTISFKTCHT